MMTAHNHSAAPGCCTIPTQFNADENKLSEGYNLFYNTFFGDCAEHNACAVTVSLYMVLSDVKQNGKVSKWTPLQRHNRH